MPNTKRLLVTGGRGRLASLLRERSAFDHYEVRYYSRTPGHGFEPIEEILTPGGIREGDAVLHLAWSTVPSTSERSDAQERLHDLPLLTSLLTNFSKLDRPEECQFIFLSTGAVYGPVRECASREEDRVDPRGCYALFKLAAEEIIREFGRRVPMPYTILRVSNLYGIPSRSDVPQGIIPLIVGAALQGAEISIWGSGDARKDYLHSTDFLSALALVLERRMLGTLNVSHGSSHSVLELVAAVERLLGTTVRRSHRPGNAWDVHDNRIDSGQFRRMAGWRPKISLDAGISHTIAELSACQQSAA